MDFESFVSNVRSVWDKLQAPSAGRRTSGSSEVLRCFLCLGKPV